MEAWIVHWRDVFVGLFVGFLGAYLVAKAKNKAMREDIAELTRVTKEIESTISHDLWGKQQRWELRRDLLLETIASVNEIRLGVGLLIESGNIGRTGAAERNKSAQEKLVATIDAIMGLQLRASVVCSDNFVLSFNRSTHLLIKILRGISNEVLDTDLNEKTAAVVIDILSAVRDELNSPRV